MKRTDSVMSDMVTAAMDSVTSGGSAVQSVVTLEVQSEEMVVGN